MSDLIKFSTADRSSRHVRSFPLPVSPLGQRRALGAVGSGVVRAGSVALVVRVQSGDSVVPQLRAGGR